ncbi:MAG TPA: hypothetical protein VLB86_06790 [Gaiellaceae bacterium]|nr:hypothetical protein [Gaiellaceae bacterium]
MSGTWRSAVAWGVAATAVTVMVVAGGVGAWRTLRDAGETAAHNSELDFADREIAWGNGWTLNQDALYAARSLVPQNADYDVLVGPPDRFEEQLTPQFVASYLHYFLMPRHQRSGARWAICYRCDRPAGTVEWEDEANGITILRRAEAGP